MEDNSVFKGLNSEQEAAVRCVEGPVLIVAGAGSGKTRVLTSRIAWMLERGCPAQEILALTFTKKAAGEMKERIAGMVGRRKSRLLVMGTFHSVFVRFLREFADSVGYPSSFTIYDTSDSISAIKTCLKELQLDDKTYKPKEVLSRISMAKNNLITPAAYAANRTVIANDTRAKKPYIYRIYQLYCEKCIQAGVMDFDDILLNMNILLRDDKAALASISDRFRYILVDEFQDTNYAQYVILRKLSMMHGNICVVGDDSQSIYAFRGAKIENILNFKKDFPGCRLFRLERNYRSTRNIVGAANSLIARNASRIPKKCYSDGDTGEKIRIVKAYTELEEGALIASAILERVYKESLQYQDFAVLYRTNSQSRALEESLRKRNIPYVIYSGNSFFERAEVKDLMSYFKLTVNPKDDESFRRAVNKPARGIGDTTLGILANVAAEENISLMEAVYSDGLAAHGMKTAAVARLKAFADTIKGFAARLPETGAREMASRIADESGLYAFFKSDTSIEGQSRTSNVEELINSVASFEEESRNDYREQILGETDAEDIDDSGIPPATLDKFLESVSLLVNVDVSADEDSNNKVALMTVHSAKGLEFPYVFVSGMEENLFPSGGMMAMPNDIEEERRLFYVALTRAEKAVTLTFARTRMRNGKSESNSPSRFLREIDSRFVENPLSEEDEDPVGFNGFGSMLRGRRILSDSYGSVPKSPSAVTFRRTSSPSPSRPAGLSGLSTAQVKAVLANRPLPPKIPDSDFTPVPMGELRAGQRIEHNRFGKGRILDITGTAPDLKAKIVFDSYGEKILLLKYAKIRLEQ